MSPFVVDERLFLHLLSDAAALLLASEENCRNGTDEGLMARSSLIHSVFVLESAANCCLQSLKYPPRLLGQVDRFQIIEKYEFVLVTKRPGHSIDRGCREVQAIQELVAIRNKYVHPKVNSGPLIAEAFDEKVIAIEDKPHPVSMIAGRPISWKSKDARYALKAAIEFLDVFFVDWCKQSTRETEWLLVSSATFDAKWLGDGEGKGVGLMCDTGVAKLVTQAGFSPRFLNLKGWLRQSSNMPKSNK